MFSISVRGSASKPRPGIIVHADELMPPDRPVLICPLTSEMADASLIRVTIESSVENGLRLTSQAMTDRLTGALPREIGNFVGGLSVEDIARVESP